MAENGSAVRLVLAGDQAPQTYHLDLPLAAGQRLALEINGLSPDRCGEHHIASLVARSAGFRISSLVLTMLNPGWMSAHLVLEPNGPNTPAQPARARADVTAALALAIHTGIPIFVEDRAAGGTDTEGAHEDGESAAARQVPQVFHDVIRSISWPEHG